MVTLQATRGRSKKHSQRKTKSALRTLVYRVKIIPDGNTFFVDAPALPGCASWGYTYEEALKNIKIAIQLWLKVLSEDGEPIPVEKIATLKRAPLIIGVVF